MIPVEEILMQAKQMKASDVHFSVDNPPKMRVNGELVAIHYPILTEADTDEIFRRVITPRAQEQFMQNGECDFSVTIPECGRFRINAYRKCSTTALAFRVVQTEIPSAKTLRIPDSVVELTNCRSGFVLVTGPTGSGKSTTQACLIDRINHTRNAHIITLEDPIEYMHHQDKSMVNQREIGIDSKCFANALRSALREDPDVIFVGEMRDLETVSVALSAAETGHLVLSTLHTTCASNAIDRIVDMFPAHQQQQVLSQLANVLVAVIAQQLIPLGMGKGSAAAFEVLLGNDAARNMIRSGKAYLLPNVIQTNRKSGMITMDESVRQLYTEGVITKEQAMCYVSSPDVILR